MLTLQVEAPTYNELVAKVAAVLGAAVEQPQAAQAAQAAQAELPAPSETSTRGKPGRPRKAKENTEPNAPQAAGEAPSGADSVDSQPAVEQNTGSEQPDTPTGGDAEPEASGDHHTAPAASAISKEDMRAKLNEVNQKFTTDTDTMAGLNKVAEIITKFGYQKVKDIDEKHFGAIAAAADEVLKAAA